MGWESHGEANTLVCPTHVEYNAFVWAASEYQEHSDAVTTSSTPKVDCAYSGGSLSTNHVGRMHGRCRYHVPGRNR